MLRVEIDIPRPLETLSLLLIAGGVALWMSVSAAPRRSEAGGAGGADRAERVVAMKSAEDGARRIRMEQAVMARREEILRYQLQIVASRGRDEDVTQARSELLRLLADQRAAEQRFRTTLNEMWEAEGLSAAAAIGAPGNVAVLWPVEPDLGLSATFLDEGYERRFGLPHHAIDIPVRQGSAVRGAADGVVAKVVESGMGYNYLLIKHEGFATLYGHVSEFFVQEGDVIRRGDVIARSGGMPGTPGAGALTTGPHLHFEVIVNGERTDPLIALPARSTVVRDSA